MDTVSLDGLQAQIDDLQKRVEALEQKRGPRATLPPLSPDQKQKAIAQILPLLIKLADADEWVTTRYISHKTALLRRLGTKQVRAYLDERPNLFLKRGDGASAEYQIKL